VAGRVKGTAFDDGTAKIEPDMVATKFWKLHEDRKDNAVTVADP